MSSKNINFAPNHILLHSWVSLIPISISIHIPHLISSFLNSTNFNLTSFSSVNSTLFSTPFHFLSSGAFVSSRKPSRYPSSISLTDTPAGNFSFFYALFFPSLFFHSPSTLGTLPIFFHSTLPSTITISSSATTRSVTSASATFSTDSPSTCALSLFQPLSLMPPTNISLNFSILSFTAV
ncbi:hypothetical protein L873DRAFT_839391 [Choiromyces venosus 120613-1]|uniref:Uncharacterized protein n=1 Tax=Choiromyces venosus 120613-1 TaxID=1336337 RepID=A0A3N4JPR1_9PEZI|nr:hypothetical protein L873DRAFT_839391 [Choiromyces venosus 120613-1]